MDARDILQRELARIEARLAALDRYPAQDPYKDGTVLKFTRTFVGRPKRYTYAAIRANNRWFTTATGDPTGGRTWTQFIQWLSDRGETGPLRVMVRKDKADRPTAPDLPTQALIHHLTMAHQMRDLGLISGTTADLLHRADHNRANTPVAAHEGPGEWDHGVTAVDQERVKDLYEDINAICDELPSSQEIHLQRVIDAAIRAVLTPGRVRTEFVVAVNRWREENPT